MCVSGLRAKTMEIPMRQKPAMKRRRVVSFDIGVDPVADDVMV
jgi:hypothetical protein